MPMNVLLQKLLENEAVKFFVYDSIKIIILLFVMISFISFLRTYIPQHKVKYWLSHQKFGLGHVLASLFGAITPFCSCSSIPIFMGFLKAGIPLGVTFSFLITSPIINEYLVVIMLGFFGWKITLAYVLSGLLVGIFSGIILGKMKLEKYLAKDIVNTKTDFDKKIKYENITKRIFFGLNEAKSIVQKLWVWILLGVGIGAVVHGFIPQENIQNILGKAGYFAVPIAVLIGVPLYANCAAIVPVAVVLFEKGVPIGTALSFMMAVSALSLPEAMILKRVMKWKLLAIFFGIVTIAIIITGYLFNLLQGFLI